MSSSTIFRSILCLRAARPAEAIIDFVVAGSKPKLSQTSAMVYVRWCVRRSGKTPAGESLQRSNVTTATTSFEWLLTSDAASTTVWRPVAQACSMWNPEVPWPRQCATMGAFQNLKCHGTVEPMIVYSTACFGTFRLPRIRAADSPANWAMFTSASADVCHAGKKLVPQVP